MEPESSLPHSQVPPPILILSQLDPVHTPTFHFLKIHRNIILPSTPGSLMWSHSLTFPHQKPVYASPLPHTCYMPGPSHSSPFYHPKNIGRGVQIIKLLIMWFSPFTQLPSPSSPKYSPQHPILKRPQPAFLPQCQRPSFTPIHKTPKIIDLFLFGQQTGRQKILHQITAFPGFNLLFNFSSTEF